MKTSELTHHFLIATPALKDPNFSKAVIYIYEHGPDGAMGLVINKPLQINLGSIMAHLDIEMPDESISTLPVFMGGPVGQEHGFIIHHRNIEATDDNEELLISASKETLKLIAQGLGPKEFIVVLGYAGWESGQLEFEINRNDWLIAPYAPGILFSTPVERRWKAAAKLLGIDINLLSDQIGHA